MSLHRAEEIANEIRARLATCTIAQGAETNLGAVVFGGYRRIDRDQIPCCVLIEGDDQPDDNTVAASISNDQAYAALAYIPCDTTDPNTAAHRAIRDMKRALFRTAGKWDRSFGGKVKRVTYGGRDIGPRADGDAYVLAIVEFTVKFVEDLANP